MNVVTTVKQLQFVQQRQGTTNNVVPLGAALGGSGTRARLARWIDRIDSLGQGGGGVNLAHGS